MTQHTLQIWHPKPRENWGDPLPRVEVHLGREAPNEDDLKLYEQVWEGTLDLPDGENHNVPLEALWRLVERGGPNCPIPRTVDKPDAIRSFTTGDVVHMDGTAYFCASVGWEAF